MIVRYDEGFTYGMGADEDFFYGLPNADGIGDGYGNGNGTSADIGYSSDHTWDVDIWDYWHEPHS